MTRDRVLVLLTIVLSIVISVYLVWWKRSPIEAPSEVPTDKGEAISPAPFGVDAQPAQGDEVVADAATVVVAESVRGAQREFKEVLSTPWMVVTNVDVDDSPITLHDKVDVAEPVVFHPVHFVNAMVGDTVTLDLPDGTRYEMRITGVEFLRGNQSVTGMIELGSGLGEYPVAFTVGKASAFATITTPHGSFSLETVGGKGWLYANPSNEQLGGPQDDQLFPVPPSAER